MRGRRAGRIVEGRRYRHDEPGIRALCARLVRLQVELVALERPDGLLIERLLDAGFGGHRGAPEPGQGDAPALQRRRRQDDVFDSFVLAQLARTDSHRFRVLVPDSDRTKALRAMTRAREGLVRTRVGLANQLRDQLALLLARRRQGVLRGRLPDRAGVPSPLPLPPRCPRSGRATPRRVPQAPRLHRTQARQRATRAAPRRRRRTRSAS